MSKNKNEKLICELGLKIVDLVESYASQLAPYEIGHHLISNGVSLILATAPNESLGIRAVLASVKNGISSYEENHSCDGDEK